MPTSALDAAGLRERVRSALASFLESQGDALRAVSPDLGLLAGAASDFLLEGGKRLRPAFCYWGWRGAGGADGADDGTIVAAASCLEFLHACALVHDDVMDGSDTRRGQPAVHRRFGSTHREQGWQGSPEAFGTSAAILLGDLCLVWADQMLATSGVGVEALTRAQPVYDEMRVELMAGQYLDLLEQALGGHDAERSMRVARFKSAKYTVERPLHLGGALADASSEVRDSYSAYGLPLGEAFQLRDDILGVFGDPAETGKPAGDDLREGKRTVLVAAALERSSAAQAGIMRRYLGDPHLDEQGVAALRKVIEQTGALNAVEVLIEQRTSEARAALAAAPLESAAADVLDALAVVATSRTV